MKPIWRQLKQNKNNNSGNEAKRSRETIAAASYLQWYHCRSKLSTVGPLPQQVIYSVLIQRFDTDVRGAAHLSLQSTHNQPVALAALDRGPAESCPVQYVCGPMTHHHYLSPDYTRVLWW